MRGDHPTLVAIMWIDIAQLYSREDGESSGRSHVGDRKACVLLMVFVGKGCGRKIVLLKLDDLQTIRLNESIHQLPLNVDA